MQEILGSILPLVVLFAIFYFLIIRPQQKQQRQHKEMVESLKKGDKVVVQGGFIVEVLKVEEGHFTVKINDDTTAKLVKDFVAYKVDGEQCCA